MTYGISSLKGLEDAVSQRCGSHLLKPKNTDLFPLGRHSIIHRMKVMPYVRVTHLREQACCVRVGLGAISGTPESP